MGRKTVLLCLLLVGSFVGSFCHADGLREDKDAKTLEQLKGLGDDSKKEHKVDFFFSFKSEAGAKAVADELTKEGWPNPIVEASKGRVAMILSKRLVPSLTRMQSLRLKFDALAFKNDGEYDGWGTEVEK
ncbi:MAG: ribonuclease E inhibitor RraB [Bdellovibrionaceae bacterium]|nr:ribonuclease E inhibitor RraB [Pseudobdellovibrionaceae bacterium]